MRDLIFCCLNAGNYCGRGAEYVNVLFDMVVRNMPAVPLRFVCLTDNPEGLDPRIEILDLPKDLERWYGKLYFFKPGLFPDGSRMVFMDLDTVIVGSLADLVAYEGEFATLEDFYQPDRVGPAVMVWEAGKASRIWTEWEAQGKPRNEMGDLWWLNSLDGGSFIAKADRLQKLLPGQFVSYKRDCRSLPPPKGSRVVCFHGIPRPHEATDEWVVMAWQIGGMTAQALETVSNTAREEVGLNIKRACSLPLPWLDMAKPHAGEAIIVAGAPSLKDFLEEVREKAASGAKVYAVNGAHRYLVGQGIVPDFHVVIDAREENADFVHEVGPKDGYLLASQCHPETFTRAMRNGKVTVVHMNTEGVLDSIPQSIKPINLISSGSTVSLAAIALAYVKGFRSLYLYGMDSSYEDTRHVYPQALNDKDKVIEAVVGGRKFKCAPWMVAQVQHFQTLAGQLAADGCELHVRSFGLLGHVAWMMTHQDQAA